MPVDLHEATVYCFSRRCTRVVMPLVNDEAPRQLVRPGEGVVLLCLFTSLVPPP